MKAVSVPWQKAFFKHFYILHGFFCFLRIISTWSKMACWSKSFQIFQGQRFFFNNKSSISLLEIVPKIIFPVFASWEESLFKVTWRVLLLPRWAPVQPRFRMVSSKPPLLQLNHRPLPLLSSLFKTFCMQPSRHKMRTQSVLLAPYNATPTTAGHHHHYSHYYLLASIRRENGATSIWRPTEKMNVAVLNRQKMQEENKPAPTKREGGKEWVVPGSSGVLPKPLEACDRSLFYPSTREIGSLCLIHSCTVSDSNNNI